MAERTVAVRLSVKVAEYNKAMQEAAQSTRKVGSEAEKLAQARESFDALGRAGMVAGGLMAAGVAVAVKRFADFDAAMSNVKAATHETSANMDLLRDAAIDAGSSTVYSAEEAAGAIEELAKAGVSTADILAGGLAGALDLAAAGELDVARAAEVTSTALNQFGLSGDDAAHVADVLAAGAGKAMGSVDDLANGLKFVGPVAASMGVSLEETTGVLALFAQQGIIGEQAGTSLRGVLSSLTSPSSQARKEIERLGLTLYDSQGNFLGLENAAQQLSGAYSNMDGASRDASLGIIFGRETVTAATALYRAGAKGVQEWTAAVDDSGYAAATARDRLDNLNGDLEALSGAMDAALIQTGAAANDTLRGLVQSITGLIDVYNDLPEPVQDAVLAVAGGTAAVTLFGGAAFSAVPKFLEMKATLDASGMSIGRVAAGAGIAGLALGGLFAIVGELAKRHAEAQARARAYADTLEEGTNNLTNASRDFAKENLAAEQSWLWISRGSAYDAAEKLGISLTTVTDAATGNVDALKELQGVLAAGEGQTEAAQEMADRLGISLGDVSSASTVLTEAVLGENRSIEDAIRLNEQKNSVTEVAAEVTKTAADAYLEAADQAGGLNDQLNQLIDTINEANGVGQDAIISNIEYQNALANVDDTIARAREGQEGYSITLDQGTEAGRNNLDMLVDLASKSQDAAQAQYNASQNTDEFRQALINGREDLIRRAQDLGYTAEEAQSLADKIYAIPPEKEFQVIGETASAQQRVERFLAAINAIPSGKTVTLSANVGGLGAIVGASANGNLYDHSRAFADGGIVQTGIYSARPAAIHKFAEPETVWEAYISGKPDQRDRNIGIWQEAGNRLGIQTVAPAASPVVYVENPFTGDYLLGRVKSVADASSVDAVTGLTSSFRGGRRV
ncbi:phage tail tape measure protein [Microbacterium imperiale]|uniref:Phage tail tape measure protein n=1 Tax=Microbacterium imperiale TaxID=33884 RepID=A0A9W6HFT4_9MICO|nr:phage tail tape measure protein [Microbacterium imperiale]MBP2422065.1 TP901 family phage tail tape measure protein [Microbacterium imperiale]MDS0200222.1 phage tail tape measure protein [Microbacterium imperiale]BFE39374.1 phage tail tape measure protein [Microbacterium imperiale]GLJ79759.1 phage tail tape measure protein [Microbacterium imperiale]